MAATLAYQGRVTTSGGSISIGTAASDRIVVAVIEHSRSSIPGRAINSVLIGGNTATINAQVGSNANSGAGVGIASLIVSTGTTATIAWTLSGAVTNAWADVYTLTGTHSSPLATNTGNGDDPLANLNTSAGGALIAGAVNNSVSAGFTWTGATSDSDVAGSFAHLSAASLSPTSAETPHSLSVASAATNEVLVAASWSAAAAAGGLIRSRGLAGGFRQMRGGLQ